MDIKEFTDLLGADFYTGVPDSQLRALCDHLQTTYGKDPRHHLIAANEGGAAALAAGYHLATGRVPVVYMQNSGEGNIINPAASLLHPLVYGIPVIFIVGWRGQPGIHDEPQHIYQGQVTKKLLEDMDIASCVVSPETTAQEIRQQMTVFRDLLAQGKSVAFVIRKGALQNDSPALYRNRYAMTREEIIRQVVSHTGEDPIVSTTGKASRELFEIREENHQDHSRDFLTVGSMGHSSSIALGLAIHSGKRVWCIDGDGAALMHLGSMAITGSVYPQSFIHILINNEAHETVGGMPTAGNKVDFCQIAMGCGYASAVRVDSPETLDRAIRSALQQKGPCLIEAACAIGARADLGRPTTTPQENKQAFMAHLQK